MDTITHTAASEAAACVVKIELDRYDQVSATISQLAALLSSISGEGFESFNNLANGYQADLLWLASDLACRAKATLGGGAMR